MAGLVENQKGYVDRLTYRKYLALDSAEQFRASSGAWSTMGTYARVFRTDAVGTTNAVWAFRKPADWVRGTTFGYVWIRGVPVSAYTGDINLTLDVRLGKIDTAIATSGAHVVLVASDDTIDITTLTSRQLKRYQFTTLTRDVSHAEDGLILVRLQRLVDTSDEQLDIFGVELIHYPTIER